MLVVTLLAAASCGQTHQQAAPATKHDTIVKPVDTVEDTQVKHEAFKEDITELPASLASFVPEGYTALDTTSGDLNLDPYPDMIMVLRKNGEDTATDADNPPKRPLLILTGQPDNTYQLAARSDNAVYCISCGGAMGDPFINMVIKKGYFSVEHYGGSSWRWSRIITFKYSPDDKAWYLHKDGTESFRAGEDEKGKAVIRTTKDFGKVPFEQFDIYKED